MTLKRRGQVILRMCAIRYWNSAARSYNLSFSYLQKLWLQIRSAFKQFSKSVAGRFYVQSLKLGDIYTVDTSCTLWQRLSLLVCAYFNILYALNNISFTIAVMSQNTDYQYCSKPFESCRANVSREHFMKVTTTSMFFKQCVYVVLSSCLLALFTFSLFFSLGLCVYCCFFQILRECWKVSSVLPL